MSSRCDRPGVMTAIFIRLVFHELVIWFANERVLCSPKVMIYFVLTRWGVFVQVILISCCSSCVAIYAAHGGFNYCERKNGGGMGDFLPGVGENKK